MKKLLYPILCFGLAAAIPATAAVSMPATSAPIKSAPTTPDGLIVDSVNQVLGIVRADRDLVKDQKRLLELVDACIVPHFDFNRMTQLAMGRAWRQASKAQRSALTDEFRAMLVRTYTKVFSTYQASGGDIDIKINIRSVRMFGNDEATVRSEVLIPDGRRVLVDYEMRLVPDGWKVFDIIVEGISLVTTYRGSFADQIERDGIDGLIAALVSKNRDAEVVTSDSSGAAN